MVSLKKENLWGTMKVVEATSNFPSKGMFPWIDENIIINPNYSRHTTFTAFFTLGYYMGVIPFKPVFDAGIGVWKIKHFRFQQVICFLLFWTTMAISKLSDAHVNLTHFISSRNLSAKKYFLLIRSLVNDAKFVMFFWILNRRSFEIEKIMNRSMEIEASMTFSTKGQLIRRRAHQFLNCIYAVYIGLYFINFLFIHPVGGFFETDFKIIFHNFVADAKHRWLLSPANTIENHILVQEHADAYSNMEIGLGVFEVLVRFVDFHLYDIVQLFFLGPLPVSFRLLMMNFTEAIKSVKKLLAEGKGQVRERFPCTEYILDRFDELKDNALIVNDVWSILNLVWVVDHSLYLIFAVNDVVSTDDPLSLTTVLVIVTLFTLALILAAEVYRKAECFKIWITELIDDPINNNSHFVLEEDDEFELKMLLKELEIVPVGIGSVGLYRFDYSFLAQLLIIIITLFVVSFEK